MILLSSYAVGLLLTAQSTQAAVAGVVRDGDSGEPLAGAAVVLTDLDRTTLTGPDGRYLLREVPAGPQHLLVRSIGYASRTLHALVPQRGELELNVLLPPRPFQLQPIEVTSGAAMRGAEPDDGTAFPDRGSSIAAVRNHPLLAEADVFQALGGGEVVMSAESPSGVHVRGGASDQTAYMLDGIPVFSPYHAAGIFSAWNPDALSRLDLSSAAPSPAHPDALSGVIAGVTRAPGARLRAQAGLSNTQARLTVDGPVGAGGAGYLVSIRAGLPSILAPGDDGSFLRGGTGDRLAKIELPALGGRVRLLGYDSENELRAEAATQVSDLPSAGGRRNAFEWGSRSLGAEWSGRFAGVGVYVRGWHASGDAEAEWAGRIGPIGMVAARRDVGGTAAVEHASAHAVSVAGVRIESSRTSYAVASDSAGGPAWALSAHTAIATAFAQHARTLGDYAALELGTALATGAGGIRLGPRATLRWMPSKRITLSGSYARLHQFAQSLRNPESIVGGVFPADLHVGVGADAVPTARSDLGVAAASWRPAPGVRLGAQAYARRSAGLLLVAPRSSGPFATSAGVVGSGTARGLSLDAAVSAARYGVMASWGWQRVRLHYADTTYIPAHGTTHLLEGGIIVFPAPTASIRVGATAALDRRTTRPSGSLEWEACNLLDRGCEFGGSPEHDPGTLGQTVLPPYVLVDLSVRKHWHVRLGGRDAVMGVFGTLTNILGRRNALTYATDPATGALTEIEMRPRAPLVVGLDWWF